MARPGKEFDFERISEALMDLRDTNKDYEFVMSKYKIGLARLKGWEQKYSKVLWKAHPVVLPSVKDGIVAKREKETEPLREKASEVSDVLLDEILKRIQMGGKGVTLQTLTAAFKEIAPYILPKFDKENNVGPTNVEKTYEVFMQKIYSKINNDVKEEITIKGAAKK